MDGYGMNVHWKQFQSEIRGQKKFETLIYF